MHEFDVHRAEQASLITVIQGHSFGNPGHAFHFLPLKSVKLTLKK